LLDRVAPALALVNQGIAEIQAMADERSGPRLLVMPAGHPLAGNRSIVLSDAASQPFVLPSGAEEGYRAGVVATCRRYGFDPIPAAQANDTAGHALDDGSFFIADLGAEMLTG